MNIVLDNLFLRKPKIEYISPPICEAMVITSSSGEIVTSSEDEVLIDL